MNYQPPYTITQEILNGVAAISEVVGRLTVLTDQARALRLRPSVAPAHPCARDIQDIRVHNRIRTIHGSLAIEGNTLSEAQITAILEGKRVIAPPREVQEVKNALAAYDRFHTWKPEAGKNLLEAHRILTSGQIEERLDSGKVNADCRQEILDLTLPFIESGNAGLDDIRKIPGLPKAVQCRRMVSLRTANSLAVETCLGR